MKRLKSNYKINNNKSNVIERIKNHRKSFKNFQINSEKLIIDYFASVKALGSKRVIDVSREKVNRLGFYYIPGKNKKLGINENQINNIGLVLTIISPRPVQIYYAKLKYPYINTDILSQYTRLQTKKYNFDRIKNKLFKKIPLTNNKIRLNNNNLISYIIGLKIEIAGRLTTERTRPRETVSVAKIGSFIKPNKITLINNSSYTLKNAKGALTVKIGINELATV